MARTPDVSLKTSLQRLQEWDGVSAFEPKIPLRAFERDELFTILTEGYGVKKFRVKQIYQWMYLHFADEFDEMTNLSLELRDRLNKTARVRSSVAGIGHVSQDGTTKFTFKLYDDAVVEAVFLPFETRNTLCISSQVGCAMGCTFCFTAKMGLVRHLTPDEIVDQVVFAKKWASQRDEGLHNIVYMGMGEPLHNVDAVIKSVSIFTHEEGLNFSRRKVTVSTSGLVDAMNKFMDACDVQLAVSLNATTDIQRSKIMPINDRYDLDTLMAALKVLPLDKRQRITLEYVMLKDFNDTIEDAARIVKLTQGIQCKMNLIPFNPHPGSPFETPTEENIEKFQQYLRDKNVSCYRRKTRGRDEMAACGQLGEPGERKLPKHLRKRLEILHSDRIKVK